MRKEAETHSKIAVLEEEQHVTPPIGKANLADYTAIRLN